MKKVMAFLLALSTALSLGACGGGGGNTQSTPADSGSTASVESSQDSAGGENAEGGEKTLRMYAWTNEKVMPPFVEAFNEKYKGQYKVEYCYIPGADTLTINTALASGEAIDVMTQASAFDMADRAYAGTYLGLKKFFDQEGWTYDGVFGSSIESIQNLDGEYYSLPYGKSTQLIWYNKAMSDAAGVPYPEPGWSWDDFRSTCIAMTSGEGSEKVYGASIDFDAEGDLYWCMMAFQEKGAFAYYNDDFTATAFTDDIFKQSLRFFSDLMLVDKCIVPIEEMKAFGYTNDTQNIIGLYNGKFAMCFVPDYGYQYLEKSFGEVPEGADIGVVDMPTLSGGKNVTTCYTSTASIPTFCTDEQGAWELIKFMCIENTEYFAGIKCMTPGIEFESPEKAREFYTWMFEHTDEKVGLDHEMALDVLTHERQLVSVDNTYMPGQGKLIEAMKAEIALVFNGESSVDDCLTKLKTVSDNAIADALKS